MYDVMDVLASGLSAARTRMNVLASNIANAQTTRTSDGGPYKRRDVVVYANEEKSGFASTLDRMTLQKPMVAGVLEDNSPARLVYEPNHPDADENGNVAYPNINVVSTMTDLITISRLYQANATALDTAKRMNQDARRIVTQA
ncbi:MAG: flagellar basal body rod protein FlgC [Bdellovibrionota bacterium]